MNHNYREEYEDSEDIHPHPHRYSSSRGRTRVGKIYKQFYRKAWEEIPEFKEWLTSIPGERSKAYCKICEKSLHAHRLSLTKHTVSLKHMRMAQKRIQEENSEIYNEECYEEEGDISEGELRYQVDENGHVVRVIKGEIMESEGEVMTPGHEVVGHEEVTVTAGPGEERLMYTSHHPDDDMPGSSSEHHQEEVIPADGVALIKIIPKQKMSSHERVNVITHHLSPGNRVIQSSSSPSGQTMSEKPHITTHVLDISKGLPVAGLPVSLYQLIDGRWILLNESSTNGDGRCNKLTGCSGIKPGRYKLHFDTERYFLLRHTPTFYPFVENKTDNKIITVKRHDMSLALQASDRVVFDVCSPTDHNHVPLLLGPFGYTTYKGS